MQRIRKQQDGVIYLRYISADKPTDPALVSQLDDRNASTTTISSRMLRVSPERFTSISSLSNM